MATEPVFRSVPLISATPQTPDTQTLRLETYFPYKSGQSLQLILPGDPKKRYYSISSSPTERRYVDVTIKAQPGTPLFESLFNIKPGSMMQVSGPYGSFTLPEDITGHFYFLAAGSGVAPFRSMVKFLLDTQAPSVAWLLHSVRTPSDLIFKDEFLLWASESRNFHYVPTFTRTEEVVAGAETGRIHEQLIKKHVPIEKGIFFLCGLPAFVTDMEHLLTQTMKIPVDRIRREQW